MHGNHTARDPDFRSLQKTVIAKCWRHRLVKVSGCEVLGSGNSEKLGLEASASEDTYERLWNSVYIWFRLERLYRSGN